jgi:hypothetical protein
LQGNNNWGDELFMNLAINLVVRIFVKYLFILSSIVYLIGNDFAMYCVNDYLEVVKDYRYKRTSNALSVVLEFDWCKVYLGTNGVGKNDLALKVTDPKLYPVNSKGWIRIEPKDLRTWLDAAKENYGLAGEI